MGKVQLLTIYNIYSRIITVKMLVETKLAAQKIGVITMADSLYSTIKKSSFCKITKYARIFFTNF
jgi:hypothetical protein